MSLIPIDARSRSKKKIKINDYIINIKLFFQGKNLLLKAIELSGMQFGLKSYA